MTPDRDPDMEPIRIAYLIDSIETEAGGTEKQLLGTLKRLDRDRFRPYLLCLHDSEWLGRFASPWDTRVLDYRGLLKPGVVRTVRQLAAFLRAERIDVLQTFFLDPIFVALLATRMVRPRPVLITSRRDLGLTQEPWYHKLFRSLFPVIGSRIDGVIANCDAIRQRVLSRDGMDPEKVIVIDNGIDPPRSDPETPPLMAGEDDSVWVVLTASLQPVKRVDDFLHALERVGRRHPHVRGVVLGDGPERKRLELLAERLGLAGRVHLPGVASEVGAWLHHADIGVLCSSAEGQSNAILEYMAAGLPVVATNVGGNPELVDELNGVRFAPGDVEALAAALIRLVEDEALRGNMGRRSLEKVRDRFSWARTMQRTEDYYVELMRRRDAPALVRTA